MLTGRRIKERRVALGMSADDLAEKLGKNRATIYRYEGDEIENFPVSIIEPLAEALLTTPAYLMGWTDDPSTATIEPAHEDEPERDEFNRLYDTLTDENRRRILDLMQVLAAGQEQSDGSQG